MKPDRWIKFNTSYGPLYCDLEQVHSVVCGKNAITGAFTILITLQSSTINLDNTFLNDVNRIMDAWMEYKNKEHHATT